MRLPRTLLYVLTLSLVACRQEASVTARWHEEPVKYLRLAVLFESANYTTTGDFVENFDRVGVTVPDETQDYRYAIERLDSRRVRIVAHRELPLIIARRLMSGFQLHWELPRKASNEFDLPLDLHSFHWQKPRFPRPISASLHF